MDKRGESSTVGVVIAIVLGLAVLVLLIYGFSVGWGNLLDRITNIGGSNVEAVVSGCSVACASQSQYDFCSLNRTIKFESGKEPLTCQQLVSDSRVNVEACPGLC